MLDPRTSDLSKSGIHKIVLIYAIFAGLWILLSDAVVHWLFKDEIVLEVAEVLKGWFFVGITSLLLYYLLRRSVQHNFQNHSSDELKQYAGLVNWKRWQQYLFAAAVTLVIVLIRLSIAVSFSERSLLILFMLPVILSAAIGGLGPGLIATLIAGLSAIYFTPPIGSLSVEHSFDWLQIGFLIANGILVSYLSMMLHEARYRSEREKRNAESGLADKSRALELLDAIAGGSTDAIYVKDVHGRYLLVNQAAARIAGKTAEEILDRDDASILPAFQAGLVQSNDRRVMQNDQVMTFQENLDTKDGKSIFHATKGPLHDAAGKVIGIFGISRDITGMKATEEALRRERDRNQRYLDTVQAIMVALDDEGRITMITKYGCDLLGYRENELLGQNWFKNYLPQPEGMETVFPVFRKLLAGDLKDTQHYENAVLCRDGSRRMISWRNIYIKNEAGNIVGTVSSGEDITERRKAEDALRESENTYRSLFEHMLNGFAYCRMLFEDGRPYDFIYLSVNQAFASQTGLNDVVGRKVSEVIPGIREADPELFEKYGRVAAGGNPEHFEVFVQALDMWFAISVYSPKPEHFVAVFDVITERKKAEIDLREAEAQYRSLFENNMDGVLLTLPLGGIVAANAECQRIFGYTEEELLEINRQQLIDISDPRLAEAQEERKQSGRFRGELTLIKKNGIKFPGEVSSVMFKNEHGQELTVVIVRDITDRKQAEEQRDLFSDALRQSAHPLMLTDLERRITYVNPAFTRLFGYQLEDMVGAHVSRMVPKADQYKLEYEEIIRHLDASGIWSGEVDRLARDGSLIPTVATMGRIRGEAEKFIGFVVSYLDLRPLREKESSLRKLSLAVEQSPESIMITNLDGRIEYVNGAFVQNTGYSREEAIGQNPRLLQSGKTPKSTYAELWKSLNAGEIWQGELYNKRKDDSEYIEHAIISPIRQPDGRITHYVAVKEDITAKKQAEAEIFRLAFYDVLTGLPNRTLLLERMEQTLSMTRRFGHYSAMIAFNIDRFKTVNDAGGQTLGDALLKAVSERLQHSLREGDVVARISGDEFGILLPDLSPQQHAAAHLALKISEKIHSSLQQPLHIGNEKLSLTACLGIALFPDNNEDLPLDILRRANTALHHSKTRGRGQTAFFEGALDEIAKRRFDIERELHQAIIADELRLFLQPQVDAAGNIVGAEALVRWQHPQRGLVPPASFIPIAEESNLIIGIGNWVFNEVCHLLAREEMAALPLRIAVNISPRHFRQPDFVNTIKQGLASTGADPAHLTLEVTEGLVIDNINDVIAKMTELSATGIHFSMDDFGTGYSSLSYLKRLPIHELKIDKSFIQDLTIDPEDDALVETILAVAKLMHLKVVAEGVETIEQAAFLNLRGQVIHQGYLFGRPELAETVIANIIRKGS